MTEALEKPTINTDSPPLSPVSVDSLKGFCTLLSACWLPADMRTVMAAAEKAVTTAGNGLTNQG